MKDFLFTNLASMNVNRTLPSIEDILVKILKMNGELKNIFWGVTKFAWWRIIKFLYF